MSAIVAIEREETPEVVYDPCCEYPHAYMSDGFVSHNCVVLIDEVEKIFTNVNDQGTTTSLLGSLLWWLQEHKSKVFTVMTTNALGKIPPELFRPGRIDDTMMFMGISTLPAAVKFAEDIFATLATTVWADKDLVDLPSKKISALLKPLFSEGKYIPQVKITQEIYTMVKKMVLEDELKPSQGDEE